MATVGEFSGKQETRGSLSRKRTMTRTKLSPARGVKAAISISTIFWALAAASGAFWLLR
jgi:hypothetical protein